MNGKRRAPAFSARPRPVPSARPTEFRDILVDGACFLALVGVPLAMGGRHPAGQALLTLAAGLVVVSALRTRFSMQCLAPTDGQAGFRFGMVEVLYLAGLLLGCAQLVPLPTHLLRAVSQRYEELLPSLVGGVGSVDLACWDRLSLTPGETLTGLGIFLAQAVLVAVVAQRMRDIRQVERMLILLAGATVGLAVLGLAQYLSGNGRFLWVYDHVYADAGGVVKGTFSNRNHYANFLAMGMGAVVWCALHRRSDTARPRRPGGCAIDWHESSALERQWHQWRGGLGCLGIAVVTFAGLSSLSRGGALAIGAALTVSIVMLGLAGLMRWALALSITGAGLLALAALSIHGLDQLAGRLGDLLDLTVLDDGLSRMEVWRAACVAIGDFPWLGTGIGSHADVSPMYTVPTGSMIFTHAESSYLNLGVEAGMLGLGLAGIAMLGGLAACAVVAMRGSDRERAAAAGIAAGLVASALHATVDFVWYVPACSTAAMLLGASAVSLASNHVRIFAPWTVRPDGGSAVLWGLFFTILLGAVGIRQIAAVRAEPAWESAIRENRKLAAAATDQGNDEAAVAGLDRVVGALERVVCLRPDHPRAWALLATARLERLAIQRRITGSEATLLDFREAAAVAGFQSREQAISWLRGIDPEAAGQIELATEEARRAVFACPLAGDAWCVLAALAFLDGPGRTLAEARVEQAVLVRPNDGHVLFETGNQAALRGDLKAAVACWRRSFATGPEMRQRILDALIRMQVPPNAVCDLLQPDLVGLRVIDSMWSPIATAADLRSVRQQRLAAVLGAAELPQGGKPRVPPARLFLEAAGLQQGLGDTDAAAESLGLALEAEPGSYAVHLALAEHAISAADWHSARSEVEWCLLRRPDNRELRDKLQRISRAQVEQPAVATPENRLRGS